MSKATKKYEEFFDYLEKKSSEKQESEDLIQTFYDTACSNGFELAKMSKKELTVEYLLYLYKNPYLNELDIDWGRIFADSLSSWNKDGDRICQTLKENQQHVITFYERCAENGIHEAESKLDPWYELANSDEYENIDEALKSWNTVPKYKEDKYNYYKTKSDLGKQILEFLVELNRKKISESKDKDYFADERGIMIIVQHCTAGLYGKYKEKLEELKSKNKLAKYTFNKYKNSVPDYDMIALKAVNIIRRRLLEKRKI